MKTFLLSCSSGLILFSNQLIAYNSIPEYRSESLVAYSSIASYPASNDTINKERESSEYQNSGSSTDFEAGDENQGLNEQSCELGEGSPVMMASGPLTYNGQIKLDDDGTGPSHNDQHHNNNTSFTRNGQNLNADVDSYVVAPGWLLSQGVKPGNRADVTVYFYAYSWYMSGGRPIIISSTQHTKSISSIVGDVGPTEDSVGEISIKAAQDLGLGIKERSGGLGPVPTDPSDQFNPNRDISATVTYYPSGS